MCGAWACKCGPSFFRDHGTLTSADGKMREGSGENAWEEGSEEEGTEESSSEELKNLRKRSIEATTTPSTLRFVQAQKTISRWKNKTLEVEGDADGFACELLQENREGLWTERLRKTRASGTIGTRRNCGRHMASFDNIAAKVEPVQKG